MTCKICGNPTKSLGTIPFDRNISGIEIVDDTPFEYHQCTKCYHISCPEMLTWDSEKLGRLVYNEKYILYDPEYVEIRPTKTAESFMKMVPYNKVGKFKHLDYGSGAGVLVSILNKNGWKSTAYDPYSNNTIPLDKFDLVTAIEVFEHSLDIDTTIKDICKYLDRNGTIIFTTQLANKDTNILWDYISARNGHINICSSESLTILAKRNNLFLTSFGSGAHILQKTRDSLKYKTGIGQ